MKGKRKKKPKRIDVLYYDPETGAGFVFDFRPLRRLFGIDENHRIYLK